MSTQRLTIKQVEQVALRLRKYGLTLDDAEALAGILAGATDAAVSINPADLASLMRPKRPKETPLSQRPEVVLRRRALRDRLDDFWPSDGFEFVTSAFTITHHVQDYATLKSAVQYRARKAGIKHNVRRDSDHLSVVTLRQPR